MLYATVDRRRRRAYVVAATLMGAAFVAVVNVQVVVARAAARSAGLAASVREGLVFLLERRLFLGAMTLDLLAVLFGGATALLPIFAEDILHSGPRALGLLRASPAIGAVLMSVVLALRPPHRRAGPTFLGAVGVFGVTIVGFALSRSLALSVFLTAVGGAAGAAQRQLPQHDGAGARAAVDARASRP